MFFNTSLNAIRACFSAPARLNRPVQLGLSVFLTEDGASYQLLMAAATFTMLPIVVLYFIAQRQFIEGIAAGGVKG